MGLPFTEHIIGSARGSNMCTILIVLMFICCPDIILLFFGGNINARDYFANSNRPNEKLEMVEI